MASSAVGYDGDMDEPKIGRIYTFVRSEPDGNQTAVEFVRCDDDSASVCGNGLEKVWEETEDACRMGLEDLLRRGFIPKS